MAKASLRKQFTGDIEGHSQVEMISSISEDGGAGYVAVERLEVRVGEREGSFVLLHLGTMTKDGESGQWPIVPGSGRGQLAGISGHAKLERLEDGRHQFTLDCDFTE